MGSLRLTHPTEYITRIGSEKTKYVGWVKRSGPNRIILKCEIVNLIKQ